MPNSSGWKALFTRQAERDIREIVNFIAEKDGPGIAEAILDRFIAVRDSLQTLPERGRIPSELYRMNVLTFREIQERPYRIVYQVNKATREVYIHLIVDGRRNFTELMRERLLRAPSAEQQ
jgi:plasmid stabilization system protein ParE